MKIIEMLLGNENNSMLHVLVILVILDYLSGICVAIHEKKLSSKVGSQGIAAKVMVFILVSISHIIDKYLFSDGGAIQMITIVFYCSNEVISILENSAKAGIPLPRKLKDTLENLKNQQKND